MKRTEKSKASRQKSNASSRQDKSMANSRQEKSRANGRQSKPKDYDRFKANHEEKHSAEERVQQGQRELKLGEMIATIPEIDFDEEIVEYKKIIQTAQKQRLRKFRRS